MGTSRTRILFIIFQLIYLVAAQEVVKRVPQGFVGMRGKKFSDTDSAELEHFFKRKPQFFVGVKGKKSYLSNLDQDALNFKRAPMGFVGMRGKKDLLSDDSAYYPVNAIKLPKVAGSLIGQIDYATNEDITNFDTALDELKKEYMFQYFNSENSLDTLESDGALPEDHITDEFDKRAAGIHQFFGVRGKKSMQNKRPYDLTFRGKFIGVRGKKDVQSDRMQELKILLENGAPWPKRKSQMGFFGMRGKKWGYSDESSFETTTQN